MTGRWTIAALATFLGTAPLRAQQQAPPSPCARDSLYRRFDFWIGEWDVTPAGHPETVVGHSVVQRIAVGCGLLENWTASNGGEGKSLNGYNRSLGHWEQFWIGGGGAVTEYRQSIWIGDTLVYLAHSITPQGAPFMQRLSFSPLDANTVRQFEQISTDEGLTWTVGYDFIYHRKKSG